MGLYDRDYERQQPWRDSYGSGGGGFQLRMPESMVNRIVLVTVAAYLIEVLFFNGQRLRNGYVPNAMIDAESKALDPLVVGVPSTKGAL